MKQATAGFVVALLALFPVPAVALECNEYSISATYWFYKKQPDSYLLAKGTLSNLRNIEAKKAIATVAGFQAGFEIWEADFKGFSASRHAFDKPFESKVTLEFPDYSFLGGGFHTAGMVDSISEADGMVWLKKTEAGYRVTAELCLPLVDDNPANVKPALRCLRGGYCPKG